MYPEMPKMITPMMNNTDDAADNATLHLTAAFLADYASLLLGCGATCIRTEKNTRRMAGALGYGFDITILPTHLYVWIWGADVARRYMAVRKTAACGISFHLNALLSRLSWEVADNHLDFPTAVRRFKSICDTPPTGKLEVLLLTSLANASFCRLFGGDVIAMLIVFFSTLLGYKLKQIMLEEGCDVRFTFLCASFFSATFSAGGHIFGIGNTPEIALGTSVLYLIPGVPYMNAVSDVLYRHYLCAFSRFIDAAILTACLSAGLCAGMLILGMKWF